MILPVIWGQLVYWHSEVFKLFELVKLKSKAFWVMLGICRVELSNQSIVLIEPSCLISIETFLVIWRVWSIHGLLSWQVICFTIQQKLGCFIFNFSMKGDFIWLPVTHLTRELHGQVKCLQELHAESTEQLLFIGTYYL